MRQRHVWGEAMSMSPRLLRPRSTVHPEAAAWATAVVANGGTVSGSTLSAVSKFCAAIASAGIRDRFYRLNLFAGNSDASLNAVRTPLFRGQSLGGTQLGSATDSQTNFAQGDYAERGASGGLAGNRKALKRLNTGFNGSQFSPYDFHVSSYEIANSDTSYDYSLGAWTSTGNQGFALGPGEPGTFDFSLINTALSASAAAGHQLAVQTGSGNGRLYRNGSLVDDTYAGGASTSSTWANVTWDVAVFSAQKTAAGTYGEYSSARLGGYSFGLAMTATQTAAFSTAMQAFQTALGRNA